MQQKRIGQQKANMLLLIAGVLVGVIVSVSAIRMAIRFYYSNVRYQEASEERARQAANKTALENHINELGTPEGKDKYIRERYRVTKSGEELIILSDAPVENSDIPTGKETGLWSWVKGLFGK